jgi:hypothetical protein
VFFNHAGRRAAWQGRTNDVQGSDSEPKNHDVDMFIENGVNGFSSSDPDELQEYLLFLLRGPQAARRIGAAGRRMALDLFKHGRYLAEWAATIRSIPELRRTFREADRRPPEDGSGAMRVLRLKAFARAGIAGWRRCRTTCFPGQLPRTLV